MNSTNLVPLGRQIRQVKATRIRAWAIVLGTLVLGSAGTYISCSAALAGAEAPPAGDFARAARELSQFNAEGAKLRAQLAHVRRDVNAARSMTERPDLSLLLSLISRDMDDQVLLSRCELAEAHSAAKPTETGAGSADAVTLRLDGFGKTQSAVAMFVLKLETAGPFDRVTLVESHRQPILGGEATAFRIECRMEPNRGGQ